MIINPFSPPEFPTTKLACINPSTINIAFKGFRSITVLLIIFSYLCVIMFNTKEIPKLMRELAIPAPFLSYKERRNQRNGREEEK